MWIHEAICTALFHPLGKRPVLPLKESGLQLYASAFTALMGADSLVCSASYCSQASRRRSSSASFRIWPSAF